MWCETQKNGTVKYCERYIDPLTEKVKKVTVTMPKDTPQNRNKAMRILSGKIEQRIEQADNNIRQNVTILELCDAYLEYMRKVGRKESSIYAMKSQLHNACELINGEALLDKLTSKYIKEAFLRSQKRKTTLNGYITILKIALKWGYQNDYYNNYSLFGRLSLFPVEQSAPLEIKSMYLEPKELDILLNYMVENDMWQVFYITKFLILTGLRIGELIALEDSDIDLNSHTIHITKTYSTSTRLVTKPKTKTSIRDVHIQPELEVLIKKIKLWKKEILFLHGTTSSLFLPYMVTGGYLNYNSYRVSLRNASYSSLNYIVSPHKLRHTHASILAAAGMTPDQIARRLGHKTGSITKQIYIHVTQQVIENDNNQLDNIIIAN